MEIVTDSWEEATIIKSNIIGILILELILLLPWTVFSALSAMGFDSDFNWFVVIALLPFWSYPLLLIFCGLACIRIYKQKNYKRAKFIMAIPLMASFGYILLLMIGGQIIIKIMSNVSG